jgi:hypothetical protein
MDESWRDIRKIPENAGLSELIPAAIYLATWISPSFMSFLGKDIGNTLSMCMWLEFIMGHAGTAFAVTAFVAGSRRSRVRMTVFFGLLYACLVVGMCFAMRSYYPLIQFGLVFYGRVRLAAEDAADGGNKLSAVLIAASRVFLLLITAGVAAVFPLPQLGATPEAMNLTGEGRMIEHPHMTMAWGVIYFTASWYLYGVAAPKIKQKLTGFPRFGK